MNVANLQLQGLLMAIGALNQALVSKGLLTVDEVDLALRKAEAGLTAEDRLYADLSPSHRDAVCFPVRLLIAANRHGSTPDLPSFSDLSKTVGETKEPYGDQL